MRQAHRIADGSFNTHLTGNRIADAGHEACVHNLKNLSGNFSSNFPSVIMVGGAHGRGDAQISRPPMVRRGSSMSLPSTMRRAIITERHIRRGSYISAMDLVGKIETFVTAYNGKARPFVWTATSE